MSNIENKTKPYFIPILRLIEMIPNNIWEEKPHKKEYVRKLITCLENEGYVIDAKSIMGIFSLDLLSPITLIAHSDNTDAFFADIARFAV